MSADHILFFVATIFFILIVWLDISDDIKKLKDQLLGESQEGKR